MSPANKAMQVRGVRNNNPGNIERTGEWRKWQGIGDDEAQGRDSRFIVFKAPKWGIRAIARLLITYADKYDLTTIHEIINRWAPPNENNSSAYVRAVCNAMKRKPHEQLDLHSYADMAPLVQAIIAHECAGYAYPRAELDAGLELAGIVSEKNAMKTPEAVGTAVAAGTGTTALGVAAYTELNATSRALREQGKADGSSSLLMFSGGLSMLAIIALGAVAFGLYRKARARRDKA